MSARAILGECGNCVLTLFRVLPTACNALDATFLLPDYKLKEYYARVKVEYTVAKKQKRCKQINEKNLGQENGGKWFGKSSSFRFCLYAVRF